MSKKRRKKKNGSGMIVFLSLIIVGCLVVIFFLGKDYVAGAVKNKVVGIAAKQVTQQVFEKALESVGDPQAAEKAKEMVDNMDEEDKKETEKIINKYADSQMISDCMDMIGDGVSSESIEQVQQYLEQNVDEEDIQKLQELYEKYGEEITQ